MGDASDNVPGVPGVGEKTAVKLMHEHGSLEARARAGAHAPPEELSGAARRARRPRAPLEAPRDDRHRGPPHHRVGRPRAAADRRRRPADGLRRARVRTGPARARTRSAATPPRRGAPRTASSRPPRSSTRWSRRLKATKAKGGFALDTETTSVDPTQAELVGLSFSWKEDEAWYVPVNRDPPMFGGAVRAGEGRGHALRRRADERRRSRRCSTACAPCSRTPRSRRPGRTRSTTHRARVPAADGRRGRAASSFDTMIAVFCLRPDARTHNLDALSLERLGVEEDPDVGADRHGQVADHDARGADREGREYACEDADCTWRLRGRVEPKLGPTASTASSTTSRCRCCRCSRGWSARHPRRPAGPRDVGVDLLDGARRRSRRRSTSAAGEAFNLRSNREDRRGPLREVEAPRGRGPQEAAAHGEGHRLLDRRGTLLGAGRAPAAGAAPRLPRADEAEVSTYVDALPESSQSADRPRPHDVPPDGRGDGTALVRRPEPAEHPDPQRGGRADPRGVRARDGLAAALGRLQPDRAAHPRAPRATTRGSSPRSAPARTSTARTAAKIFGLEPAAVTPDARPRQGDQLRHHLRHGPAAARRARRA